jgi:hypothetical protein
VPTGEYGLNAEASVVPGETRTDNNIYIDSVVTLFVRPHGLCLPSWFCWFLLLLLLLILLLFLALLFWRRRRDSEEAFYSGWTAWYYGYDPQNKAVKSKAGSISSKAERLRERK